MRSKADIKTASRITGLHEVSVEMLKEGGSAITKTIDGLLMTEHGRVFLANLFCAFHTACNGIEINDDDELAAALNKDISERPLLDNVVNLIDDPYEEAQTYYMMYMQRAIHNLLVKLKAEHDNESEDNEELRPET